MSVRLIFDTVCNLLSGSSSFPDGLGTIYMRVNAIDSFSYEVQMHNAL